MHNTIYRQFIKRFVQVFLGIVISLAAFIIFIDPLDNIPFSPPLHRAVMANNQRFSYPAIARNPDFDSVLIGNSVLQQFDPELLNRAFNGRFANLSMSSATPYEQYRMAALFFRHHPHTKMLILGVDARSMSWCQQNVSNKYATTEFPEWMYGEDKWSGSLYLLNGKVLEAAVKQAGYFMGNAAPSFNKDGFAEVIPKSSNYAEQARLYIYGQSSPKEKPAPLPFPELTMQQADLIGFPASAFMEAILYAAPEETIKIIFFAPQHWYAQPIGNSADAIALESCKRKISHIAQSHSRTYLMNFMNQSAFTTNDANYLDDIHLTKKASDTLIDTITKYVILHP